MLSRLHQYAVGADRQMPQLDNQTLWLPLCAGTPADKMLSMLIELLDGTGGFDC